MPPIDRFELARHFAARARHRTSTRGGNDRKSSFSRDMSNTTASNGDRALSSSASSNDDSGGVSAAFALTLSVVSSVSLVIVNKHLISALGFREGARERGAAPRDAAPRRDARNDGGRPEIFPEVASG